MALQHLTEEQVRTWSREQKDRWWLDERLPRRHAAADPARGHHRLHARRHPLGHEPLRRGQDRLDAGRRASPPSSWPSAMFKILSRLGAKDMTILENNACSRSPPSAGYMTGPLISGMAAYMMVQNRPLPWGQMIWFNVVLSHPRGAGRLPDEAALHQRRAAAVPRGAGLRRRARHALHLATPRSGSSRPRRWRARP